MESYTKHGPSNVTTTEPPPLHAWKEGIPPSLRGGGGGGSEEGREFPSLTLKDGIDSPSSLGGGGEREKEGISPSSVDKEGKGARYISWRVKLNTYSHEISTPHELSWLSRKFRGCEGLVPRILGKL